MEQLRRPTLFHVAKVVAIAAVSWLFTRAELAATPAPDAADDWPVYRHDTALTSVSRRKGKITEPAVTWEYYLGVAPAPLAIVGSPVATDVADLDGHGTDERFSLDGDTITVSDLHGKELWQYRVSGLPLGGNVRVAKLLPDRKGLQILSFSSRMDTGVGQGYLFAFDKGATHGELVWTTGPLTGQHSPTLVIDDVDGDGLPDIVVAPHYRVQIFNGQTGKLKTEIPWEVGRNYGILLTIPSVVSQHKDICIVCDFVPHVDCIGFRDGGWKHVWGHKYMEPNRPTPRGREQYIHVGPNLLADLDGDGREELAYMLCDATTDDAWHLHIRKRDTGELAADIAGIWVWSIIDLDGREPAEIVYTATPEKRPGAICDLNVAHLQGDRLVDVTMVKRVRPLLTNAVLAANVHTIADEGLTDLVHCDLDNDGVPELFCAKHTTNDGVEDTILAISFASLEQGQQVTKWEFSRPGHRLNLLKVDSRASPAFEIRDLTAGQTLTLDAKETIVKVEPTGRIPGFTTTPIVVDLDCDGRNEIVLQNAAGEIVALRAPQRGASEPKVIWKTPGVAMSQSAGYLLNGGLCPQAGDVDGDGFPEIVFTTEGKNGLCEVVCADGRTGKANWRRPIEGATWGGLQAGVDGWTFGRFLRRSKGLDVAVGLHRRSKNSAEGWMLRGDNGAIAWKQEGIRAGDESASPFNADLAAVVDANGDGADEMVIAASVTYVVVSGETGQPIIPPTHMPGPHGFGKWIAYSSPTVADLNSDGLPEVYLNSSSYARGGYAACRLDGKPLWVEFHDNNQGSDGFGPVGDFDGDGHAEIGIPVLNGTLTCRNAADNSTKWTIQTPVAGDVVAGDVDGDGIMELVFAGRDGRVHAVSGKDGHEVWSIAASGRPILADVDGDHLLEVLVVGSDGVLRVIGQSD